MSLWMIVQLILNILLALFVYIIWVKLRRPPQDDPRLSKGLQLLQSKISVLTDLSDKTEVQVEKLNAFMEKKLKQVQACLIEADSKMQQIELATRKTKEVAQIFQEEIPHDEIVKRQNTIKYIKAAKLANKGATVEEIAEEIDLPLSEIELIAKLNKDNLVFDDDSLPEWAKEEEQLSTAPEIEIYTPDFSDSLKSSEADYSTLKRLGEQFRQACTEYQTQQEAKESPSQIIEKMKSVSNELTSLGAGLASTISQRVQHTVDSLSAPPTIKATFEEPTQNKVEPGEKTSETPGLDGSEAQYISSSGSLLEESVPKRGLSIESVGQKNSPAFVLNELQSKKRLELSKGDVIKKVHFPKLEVDVNKTLG